MPTGVLVGLLDPVEGVGAFLGCLLGIVLTPDLDMIAISLAEWGMVKKLGPLGFFWMGLWYFYARVIPHRSPWSHWPVLGTAIRLAYCTALLVIIWVILGRPALPIMPVWGLALLHGWVKGLVVSDAAHFILDLPLKRKKGKK